MRNICHKCTALIFPQWMQPFNHNQIKNRQFLARLRYPCSPLHRLPCLWTLYTWNHTYMSFALRSDFCSILWFYIHPYSCEAVICSFSFYIVFYHMNIPLFIYLFIVDRHLMFSVWLCINIAAIYIPACCQMHTCAHFWCWVIRHACVQL